MFANIRFLSDISEKADMQSLKKIKVSFKDKVFYAILISFLSQGFELFNTIVSFLKRTYPRENLFINTNCYILN